MYNLLIVDDEFEIRDGLSKYFPWDEIGFTVIAQAENGVQALQMIKAYEIDVMLSDIRMPMMDGINLARTLHEQKTDIEIVFMSGYRDFEYAVKALEFGVKSYLVKPTNHDDIKELFIKIKDGLDSKLGKTQQINPQDKYEIHFQGPTFNEKIIETINNLVIEKYRDVTLEMVAKIISMNPQYVSKYYKQQTGNHFSDHVISVKMKMAARLLEDIHYKTYEISDLVGYSSPKNFTRTFRNFFGMSPREFRNRGAVFREDPS